MGLSSHPGQYNDDGDDHHVNEDFEKEEQQLGLSWVHVRSFVFSFVKFQTIFLFRRASVVNKRTGNCLANGKICKQQGGYL